MLAQPTTPGIWESLAGRATPPLAIRPSYDLFSKNSKNLSQICSGLPIQC